MKSIEVSARTIEEAISNGLQKLGCSISDCKVEILQEGAKGLFGFFGSRPASVRLTLTDTEAEDAIDDIDLQSSLHEPAAPAPQRQPKKPREKVEDAPKAEKAAKQPEPARRAAEPKKPQEKNRMRIAVNPQVVDRPSSDVMERFKSAPLPNQTAAKPAARQAATRQPAAKQPKAQPQAPVREKAQKPARPARAQQPQAPRAQPQAAEMRERERAPVPAPENIVAHAADTVEGIAQRFLLEVTSLMGVTVQVDVLRGEDGHLFATMYGDTLGILIGRRGETLDALQYLTSLQVNKGREEYVRVTLDTENYRAKREEALVRLGARMASRAIKTGRKVSLEPMNPYERRILHASLQGNPGVNTHSEGDEPYRHVVIVPVKQ